MTDDQILELLKFRPTLERYFTFHGLGHRADDAADEVIFRVFKNSRAERIENIRRFAMKTASYVVLEWHRAEPRNIVSTDEAVDRAAPQADLHEDDLDRGVLRLCLQQLAPTDRDLIVRFYAEGKNKDNRRDLANQLHISLEALHTRACRVIKDLRECFATRLASKRGRS